MGLNCGAKCAKYVLFAFNIIFFLGGAAVLGVGIWLRVDSGSYLNFLTQVDPSNAATDVTSNILSQNLQYIHAIAYVMIGIGAFVFLVGFMGCCGACKEWRPLLVGYAICLIIIMCVEVGVGIAVGVYKDEALKTISTEMKGWARSYDYRAYSVKDTYVKPELTPFLENNAPALAATNGWNAMQVMMKCCGASSAGYLDFLESPYWTRLESQRTAPVFCCRFDDPYTLRLGGNVGCGLARTSENSYMNEGCVQKATNFVESNAPAVIGVAVGIGLIELVGVIFAFCLCCAIGDKYGKGYD